jgi:hypothetical protein
MLQPAENVQNRVSVADEDDLLWAAALLHVEWPEGSTGLVIRQGDKTKAVIVYNCFFDNATCSAHIASDSGKTWATRNILYGMFAYPFLQLGLRRVTLPIAAKNVSAQVLALKLGFKPEGFLRHARIDDDEIVYGMIREECPWIKEN